MVNRVWGNGLVKGVITDCEFHHGHQCPICGTNETADVVLVAVHGTNEPNDKTYIAALVHVKCLLDKVIYFPDSKLIGTQAEHDYVEKT